MRFSTSLAAVALLTFGNLFPSTVGAPTGLSERTFSSAVPNDLDRRAPPMIPKPPSAPKPPQPPRPPPPPPPSAVGGPKPPGAGAGPKEVAPPVLKTYPTKDVPNPFDETKYHYTKSVREKEDPNWGTVIDVKTKDYKEGKAPVDVIAINKDKNSIGIMEAWNAKDVPAEASKKLSLADIEMNLFTSAGKKPQDLKLIHVDNVQNAEARSAIVNVYKMNSKSTFNAPDITFKASAAAGSVERNSFNTLLGTPFGIGADKLRQQYSVGKQITAFKVSNHKGADGNNVPGELDMDMTFG